uniref:DUF3615 domain-containing protein n=1 Tax=Leersia perrieri TaxID=77586 RepID=A0A0D9WLG5_9ORYZ
MEEHRGLVNAAESSSAQVLRETDASFSKGLLSNTSSKEPITSHTSSSPQTVQCKETYTSAQSQCCSWSSPESTILFRRPPEWYLKFYIRMDRGGCFHIYPDVGGGPFQSLSEADDAITQHLRGLRVPSMGEELDRLPLMERMIRQTMYWPDGKRKHSKSGGYKKDDHPLIQALVEKYNDDHNLLGDSAYEVKELLQLGTVYEDHRWYYHINFTAKLKGAYKSGCATDNLFFAEISHMQGEQEWVVSCCCIIKSNANGRCNGCINDGRSGLKHPNNTDAYSGGHLDGRLPFGLDGSCSNNDDLDPEAEEAMLRSTFKDIDVPGYLEKLFT